jgi:hypothetical protein
LGTFGGLFINNVLLIIVVALGFEGKPFRG